MMLERQWEQESGKRVIGQVLWEGVQYKQGGPWRAREGVLFE